MEKRLADVLLFFLKLPAAAIIASCIFVFLPFRWPRPLGAIFARLKTIFIRLKKVLKQVVFLTEITRFPNYRNTRWSCPSTVGRSDYSSPDQHVESLRYCLFPLLVPGQIKNSCQNGKKDTTTCAYSLFEV